MPRKLTKQLVRPKEKLERVVELGRIIHEDVHLKCLKKQI